MNNPNIIEKELSYKIVGLLFEVHNKLGGEYQEKYYQRAFSRALKREKINFEEQIHVDLEFDKEKIGKYFLDFLIEGKVILEIKAKPRLSPIDFRQVRAYLKAKNLELGILANFKRDRLSYKRILFPIRTINSDNFHSDPFVLLARQAVEEYIKTGIILKLPVNLPKELLTKRAGVFVSIYTKSGELRGLPRRHALATRGRRPREQVSVLRGCIGTFLPTKPSIAQEIIANAISSAVHDPRFPPVSEEELPDLVYSVDILSEPKKLDAKRYTPARLRLDEVLAGGLNPKTYGLIVSTPDGRRGLLLPDIPGVNTPEEQFRICCYKAGIHPEEKVVLHIFTVTRHHSD